MRQSGRAVDSQELIQLPIPQSELRKRNAKLAKDGKRMCGDCGHIFRATPDNFFTTKNHGKVYLRAQCRRCWYFHHTPVKRARYNRDEDYRKSINARRRERYRARATIDPEFVLKKRRSAYEVKFRKKRKAFDRIIVGDEP